MSKRLTYQLCSNNTDNFSEVEFQPIIPWNCERIKYRVKSVNTFANFLITSSDDVLNVYDDVVLKSPLFICLEIEPVENTMYQLNY